MTKIVCPLEAEYIRAYENYMGGLGDLRILKDAYDQAAMMYLTSIRDDK
jgi:hypothetical protein